MSTKKTKLIVLIATVVALIGFLYFIGKLPNIFKSSKSEHALPAATTEALDVAGKINLPIDITVHEGHGHIVEGYKGDKPQEQVIIHIQDIHTNYEAQKNSANIIEALIKEKGLKLIMVEGGWGDVSLTYMRDQANKERRIEVAEEYLEEGKIAGEEYLNIISDYDMELQGIEEEALYKENLDVFFKIEAIREEGTNIANELREVVDSLKQKTYPKKLLEMEAKYVKYEEEDITLAELYAYLTKLAQELQISIVEFSNFVSFNKISELESAINFPKVEKERATLIEKLSKALKKEKLAPLVTKSLEFRLSKVSAAEYHTYLNQVAQEAGVDLKKYPNLLKYTDYMKSHERIDTNELFKEADLLKIQLEQATIENDEQKKIYALSRVLNILYNCFNLKLIPDDFTYYKEHKDDFPIAQWKPFLKEEMKKYNLKQGLPPSVAIIDDNIPTLIEFYDLASRRDEIFIKKANELMKEKKQKIAVLIAGGFHTPNLIKMLKEESISYIIIAPKTTEETDPDQYRYIMEYKSGRTE